MLNKDDKKKLEISGKLSACKKVSDMLKTEGWKDIVEPLLNAMIEDVTGRKKGQQWIKGWIHKEQEKALGYQDALITFYNRVYDYETSVESLEKCYKDLDREKIPMTPMQRSSYRQKGETDGI